MAKRVFGPCETCPDPAPVATHRSTALDGQPHDFCDACYTAVRKIYQAQMIALNNKSPYPGGDRRTFFRSLRVRDIQRKYRGIDPKRLT